MNIEKDKIPVQKKIKKRASINIAATQYEIIPQISKSFGWRVKSIEEDDDDSDVIWTDCAVPPEKLCKMRPYQKINHFPNMHELAKKNYLAKNLNKMQKNLPTEYDFFPKTWLYPSEFSSLKIRNQYKKVFIVKPEGLSQGKGIFLTKTLEGFEENVRYVIQEYIPNPLLIDGLKFDLRIYVLLAGCDPLKIFLYNEGLGRFATEVYQPPCSSNFSNTFIHLTNYAINKNSENFIFNSDPKQDNVGHKRSLTATLRTLKDLGFDTSKIWNDIKLIIIKTLISAQPSIAHVYKACQPDDPYNGMCFELLGFDVMIDDNAKTWLLEVNHSPSFNIDSPLDYKIKFQLISEALVLLNIDPDSKKEFLERKRRQMLGRTLVNSKEQEKENKKVQIKVAQMKRSEWEAAHLGGFELIYPNEDRGFEKHFEAAMKVWIESTGGKVPGKERPPTQENRVQKDTGKAVVEPAKKVDLAVFQRLYQIKKVKVERSPIPPCIQLDEAFKTQYFKSHTPYSLAEIAVPQKFEEKRYKSIPKKRISHANQHLDEILRDRRVGESIKRSFNLYDTPLQISSVITDDLSSDRAKLLKQLVLRRIF